MPMATVHSVAELDHSARGAELDPGVAVDALAENDLLSLQLRSVQRHAGVDLLDP